MDRFDDEQDEDEGLIAKAKKLIDRVNPFAQAAAALTPKAPKTTDGLLKGRSTSVFNENVATLRKRGLSEAEAIKRARERMMEQ